MWTLIEGVWLMEKENPKNWLKSSSLATMHLFLDILRNSIGTNRH